MTESVLEISQKMGDIFNELNADIAHRYLHDDFVDYEAPPGTPGGPEGYLGTARWMNGVFENAHWDHLDSFSEGDRAVIRVRFTGKHVGDFLGFAPTHRDVSIEQMHIYKVVDGLVTEHWGCRQDLDLMVQLGIIEVKPPGAAAS